MVEIQLFDAFAALDTSFTYGYFAPWVPGRKFVKTSGSSTTVTSATASSGALAEVSLYDRIAVNRDGTVDVRSVATDTDDDTVVVNSAVNWERGGTGYPYQFSRWVYGTAATSGWFGVSDFVDKTVQVIVSTLSANSVEVIIHGRIKGNTTAATIIYPTFDGTDGYQFLATGSINIPISETVTELRVGFKRTGASTHAVTALFKGRRAR